MVRLRPPEFIVLDKNGSCSDERRITDLSPMPKGVVVFLAIVLAMVLAFIGAAAAGMLTARAKRINRVRPAASTHAPARAVEPPAPIHASNWKCWSSDGDYCRR
jgi:hypothetical protein